MNRFSFAPDTKLRSTRPSPRYDAPRLARDMPATTPATLTLAQAWASLRSFVRGL